MVALTAQHQSLMQAVQQQTEAMRALADSNKELAAVLTQLIVDTTDEAPTSDQPGAGMGDVKGGYITKPPHM